MYIPGAKFEEHCSNISRDVLDSVLQCFSETIYDVIAFLIFIIEKCQYLSNGKKRFSKKENTIVLYFEKPSSTL